MRKLFTECNNNNNNYHCHNSLSFLLLSLLSVLLLLLFVSLLLRMIMSNDNDNNDNNNKNSNCNNNNEIKNYDNNVLFTQGSLIMLFFLRAMQSYYMYYPGYIRATLKRRSSIPTWYPFTSPGWSVAKIDSCLVKRH